MIRSAVMVNKWARLWLLKYWGWLMDGMVVVGGGGRGTMVKGWGVGASRGLLPGKTYSSSHISTLSFSLYSRVQLNQQFRLRPKRIYRIGNPM